MTAPDDRARDEQAAEAREQWQADAERFVRHACYPHERVSDQVSVYTEDAERAQLAHIARAARLGAGRVARLLEKDGVRVADIERELTDVHRLLRFWKPVQERAADAAEAAVTAAIDAEVERRRTDGAWEQELRRRAMINADWVLPARAVGGDR